MKRGDLQKKCILKSGGVKEAITLNKIVLLLCPKGGGGFDPNPNLLMIFFYALVLTFSKRGGADDPSLDSLKNFFSA